ncbi:sorting nexin, partial [Phlyctochytrium bullatum]
MSSSSFETFDVISKFSNVTASSEDTSGDCSGKQCVAEQAILDGADSDDGSGDLTWWQSTKDTSCSDQWFNLDWTGLGPQKLVYYRLIYGPLGDRLNGANPVVSYSTFSNPKSYQQLQYGPAGIDCVQGVYNDSKQFVRADNCTIKADVDNAASLKLTWKLQPKDGACQINIEETKHIATLHRHLIQQGATAIDDIPDLPKAARALLASEFTLSTSKVVTRSDAKDGSTTKLLVELQDGQRIETVIMRYGDVELSSFPQEEKDRRQKELEDAGRSFKSNKRATVCISSQVGCAMGCTFCATGTMGLLSNLTTGEIIEQLVHANKVEKIRNVVFMGMGEPLDNYPAVLSAITMMLDTARFGLSPSRVTISTVGVVPRIRDLMKDLPQIGLALSLHAPTQELRCEIVPTAKAWPLDRIIEVTRDFIRAQNAECRSGRRHILIEYVLIAGVNDSVEVAAQLGELLAGMDVLLNVIPYNVTEVPHDYKPPNQEAIKAFLATVRSYGVHTLVRQELGSDISSACGQLVIKNPGANGSKGGRTCDVQDLEDLGGSQKKSNQQAKIVAGRRRKTASSGRDLLTPELVIGTAAVAALAFI